MSTTRKKHPPIKVRGNWRWIYAHDGKRLAGVLQQVNTHWRAIKIDPDTGRDRQVAEFELEADALRFITTTTTAEVTDG
jgi:hypothetical protein